MFADNYRQFEDRVGQEIESAGSKVTISAWGGPMSPVES